MYRALRLLARSRRLLRVPSAGAAVSGEATTLPRCAPNVARMVSGAVAWTHSFQCAGQELSH
uniref:Fumarate hydratase 1 n=1 Tax=Mus musculus TaxID=10090 RepID=H3BJV5_MOUSE